MREKTREFMVERLALETVDWLRACADDEVEHQKTWEAISDRRAFPEDAKSEYVGEHKGLEMKYRAAADELEQLRTDIALCREHMEKRSRSIGIWRARAERAEAALQAVRDYAATHGDDDLLALSAYDQNRGE